MEIAMIDPSVEETFVGFISPVKILGAEIIALILIFILIFPGNTTDLVYTKFLFGREFLWLRILSCALLAVAVCLNIPNLYRSLAFEPSVVIRDGCVTINGFLKRKFEISEIQAVSDAAFGSSLVTLRSGKRISIPIVFYKDARSMRRIFHDLVE